MQESNSLAAHGIIVQSTHNPRHSIIFVLRNIYNQIKANLQSQQQSAPNHCIFFPTCSLMVVKVIKSLIPMSHSKFTFSLCMRSIICDFMMLESTVVTNNCIINSADYRILNNIAFQSVYMIRLLTSLIFY